MRSLRQTRASDMSSNLKFCKHCTYCITSVQRFLEPTLTSHQNVVCAINDTSVVQSSTCLHFWIKEDCVQCSCLCHEYHMLVICRWVPLTGNNLCMQGVQLMASVWDIKLHLHHIFNLVSICVQKSSCHWVPCTWASAVILQI